MNMPKVVMVDPWGTNEKKMSTASVTQRQGMTAYIHTFCKRGGKM